MEFTIAVDLSKNVFQVAESVHPGKVRRERRLTRRQFERYLVQCPPRSRFLFEACGSAHYWGRQVESQSHRAKLLPPHRTRSYRVGNKTDRTDTLALLEADRNEKILGVPVKSEDQQCLASLHRLRSGYVTTRTARLNAIRGLLREYGIRIPVGARKVIPAVVALEKGAIPIPLRAALQDVIEELQILEERIRGIEDQLKALAQQTPMIQHLLSVPGIGIITATALAGMVGSFHRFPSGRHLAAYLGLVPKEHSSGSRRRLGGISKQGDTYLRTLLIHGGRSVLAAANRKKSPRPLDDWALQVQRRRGYNLATVGLANKIARFVWVAATQNRDFRP